MTDVGSRRGVFLGPFFEAMGLAAGVMRSPIRQVSPQYREYIQGRLKELGVV